MVLESRGHETQLGATFKVDPPRPIKITRHTHTKKKTHLLLPQRVHPSQRDHQDLSNPEKHGTFDSNQSRNFTGVWAYRQTHKCVCVCVYHALTSTPGSPGRPGFPGDPGIPAFPLGPYTDRDL